MNEYEPVYWQEIMMPNGTLYTNHSSGTGGVHDGDMRQSIGKELISLGINNANYGIFSSPGKGENGLSNRFAAAQLTVHNSVGNYANGRVVHGLSGGGGIVTLHNSLGNEFSHEIGHNYGLGHYPNGFKGSVHRSAENINSTWGWDSDLNVFLPNFAKLQTGASTCYQEQCQPPFNGHPFGFDSMAGGEEFYPATNQYTLYTPYSLRQAQIFFESKIVFDKNSSTGYRKWSEETKSMAEWSEFHSAGPGNVDLGSMIYLVEKYQLVEIHFYDGNWTSTIELPSASSRNRGRGVRITSQATFNSIAHINGQAHTVARGYVGLWESNGSQWVSVRDFSFNALQKPSQQGVPVTTILGYYDPESTGSLRDYVYPALHCAYGNVFSADRDVAVNACRCYAEVKNGNGQSLKFILRQKRESADAMNRLHINVASAFSPSSITIYRDGVAKVTKALKPPLGGTRYTINGRK